MATAKSAMNGSSVSPEWKEATAIGLASFSLPFLGCAAVAYYLLHWNVQASWLAGVALSTTSIAVVYAVMLELGLNNSTYGKTVLAACFITDLGTVLALGLIFTPFSMKTVYFAGASMISRILVAFDGSGQSQKAYVQAVDAIVMGHRGESLFRRWLLGSVAKRVLSYAQCTVIIVR